MSERVASTATSLLAAGRRRGGAAEPRAHPVAIILAAPGSGRDLDLADADPAGAAPAVAADRSHRPRVVLPGQGSVRPRDAAERAAASPGFEAWSQGEPLDCDAALHHRRQTAHLDLLHRPPRRRRAHVLRLAAAQPGARVDARPDRHVEPARVVYMDEIFGYFPPARIHRRKARC